MGNIIMAVNSRTSLKEYCLRRLGKPVIAINVSDEQVEDRIDDALQQYSEWHYDATEEKWLSYQLTADDVTNRAITLPDNILVVVEMLPITSSFNSSLYTYNNQVTNSFSRPYMPLDIADYAIKSLYINTIYDMLDQNNSIEFTRHKNTMKIHTTSESLKEGMYIALKVYEIIDPESYNSVYNDKWLKEYATQLIKKQWGENLKKHANIQLLGGITLNGKEIYDEAVEELIRLDQDLTTKYSEPAKFFIG